MLTKKQYEEEWKRILHNYKLGRVGRKASEQATEQLDRRRSWAGLVRINSADYDDLLTTIE